MDISDLTDTIVPKSDQLNADDLMVGPVVYRVAGVERGDDDQPLIVALDGSRPYKPCKSMRRVLIAAWGPDGSTWPGRSLKLYRDEQVKWGGRPVGGIRIGAMSHIDRPLSVALTVTRGKRAPFCVDVLQVDQPPSLFDALDGVGVTPAQFDEWATAKGKPALAAMDDATSARVAAWLSGAAGAAAVLEMLPGGE